MAVANRFEELVVWQRMHELHLEVWKATEVPPSSRDFKFKAQIRDASESAVRNVAEGFGRYNPLEFARFLDIARASVLETQALLIKGRDVGYWPQDEFERLNALADRGLQALAKFQRYLRSPEAKRNAERRYGQDKNANGTNANGTKNENGNEKENEKENGTKNGRNEPNDPNPPNDPNDP